MIHDAPLAETVRALRSGTRDPREYLETLADRMDTVESEIEALVTAPQWDDLEATVTGLEDAYPDPPARPPLFGIPIGVKDIFNVDGLPTYAGSDLPAEAFEGPEATVVERLRSAGAMVFAKTVTTEFAYFEPGPTRNPHNRNHTPGGSSSGSAAAVATGLCPLALGSQTVGSTIRPAAFCGIVGFKPSFDRIPIGGVVPLAESLDHVGLFTQDLAGMRIAAAVACDEWRSLPAAKHRPVLGVPADAYLGQATAEGRAAFDDQLETLDDAGFEVRHTSLFEDIDGINARHTNLLEAEAALAHHNWYTEYGDRYSEKMTEAVRTGRDVTMERLGETRNSRLALRRAIRDRMTENGIDLWVAPGATGPAPEGIDSTGDPVMNLPWTNAGVPVVTFPTGEIDGLPIGLQVAGQYMADEYVLDAAAHVAGTLNSAE